jgi:hypothetical protein
LNIVSGTGSGGEIGEQVSRFQGFKVSKSKAAKARFDIETFKL